MPSCAFIPDPWLGIWHSIGLIFAIGKSVLCVVVSLTYVMWSFGRVLWFFLVPSGFFKHCFWNVLHRTSCIHCFHSINVQFRLFFPSLFLIICGFACILHTSLVFLVYWFLLWWFFSGLQGFYFFAYLFSLGTYWWCLFPSNVSLPSGHVKLAGHKTSQNYLNCLPAEYFFSDFRFKPWSQLFHYKNIVVFHLKRKVCVPF